MEKLKILQVNKFYPPVVGGIEQVVRQISEGLADKTDMKVLVCQQKGKGYVDEMNGVKVYRASSIGTAFSMPISIQFFSWFHKLTKDCDILHVHMPFPLADAAMLLYGFKGKVLLWWHSDIVRQKYFIWLYKPMLMNLLERADVIITATEGNINGSDFLPLFRKKCITIPFGVTVPTVIKDIDPVVKNGKETIFLSVGRLIYYKGYDILLKAFATVPKARLIIIGDGPLRKYLNDLAKCLDITNKVIFRGSVSDTELEKAFNSCDVFVLPSVAKSEAFGLVQIEAMSRGKPVINTKLNSGVPYVSLDGITGLTVPPNDISALADAMNLLVNNEHLREEFGQAALIRVKDKFSLNIMLDKVLNVYEEFFQS